NMNMNARADKQTTAQANATNNTTTTITATGTNTNTSRTTTYPKAVVQNARYDGNRIYVIIDSNMAKHLGVKDGDSWLEINHVAVSGGVFLTKHYRWAPPHDGGIT
ncbi:MAG: hypothetical protein ACJ71R_22645, partial [Nitrososphaeraceae archaeon]